MRAAQFALSALLVLLHAAPSWSEEPEPRVRPLRELDRVQEAAKRQLLSNYREVFSVLRMARACGLDWQPKYDDFVLRLDRRHGALEMDGRFGASVPVWIKDAMSAQQPQLTCPVAAEQLKSLQLPAVPNALLVGAGKRVRPDSPNAVDDVFIFPDGEFMRAAYAEKLGSDWKRALWTRTVLYLGGDVEAAAALDRHLQSIALAALGKDPPPPPGTVDEIVEHQRGTGPALARQRAALLAAALTPHADPNSQELFVALYIENTSPAEISQFNAALRLPASAEGAPLELGCRLMGGGRPLHPGTSNRYECGEEHRHRAALPKVMQAVKEAHGRWSLQVNRIDFKEPPVSFNATGARWIDDSPEQAARLDLKAAGCGSRGSCLAEVRQQFTRGDGNLFKLAAHVLFWAAVAAFLPYLSPWRRLVAALILSALFTALWLVAVVEPLDGANSLVVAALVVYAPLWFAWYLGILWSIVLGLYLYQRRKKGPDPSPT